MKHRLLPLLCIIGFMQNSQILSSCNNVNKTLHQKENPKKIIKIANLLKSGLTFFQAYDAYELQFNLAKALIAAQNNKLKTFESYFKKRRENGICSEDDAWFEQYSYNKEKSETERYLEMASFIKKDHAQTVIAAHFRGNQARHNIKTGK